jgi:hypothetical protein
MIDQLSNDCGSSCYNASRRHLTASPENDGFTSLQEIQNKLYTARTSHFG